MIVLIEIQFPCKCFVMLSRHQLLSDDELGPVYDLLIVEPVEIRRAIGSLVYDNFIAQKFSSSRAGLNGIILKYQSSRSCCQ